MSARQAREPAPQESSHVRPQGVGAPHLRRPSALQSECPVCPALEIAEDGVRQRLALGEPRDDGRLLEGDSEHDGLQLIQLPLMLAQLRKVLPTGKSAQLPQEHQRDMVPVEVRKVHSPALLIQQLDTSHAGIDLCHRMAPFGRCVAKLFIPRSRC